jgi:hypothetical protein
MRKSPRSIAALLAVACSASACASGVSDVLGRDVILVPTAPRTPKPRGELLAVQDGRIWLRTKDGVREMEAASFREVQVQRHGYGGGSARRLGLIGGLVSAIALTASCSSVDGNGTGGCAAVGAAIGGLLAVTGVLSSMSLDASSRAHMAPDDLSLRAYARFPAGLPKDVPPASLAPGPRKSNRVD